MADKYDNTNTGALFRAKEQKTDRHPSHTGSINVDGREYWLSGWVKESKNGQKFFSLSVKAKDEKPEKRVDPPMKGGPKSFEDFQGDVPF